MLIFSFFSFLLLGLELSGAQGYQPQMHAEQAWAARPRTWRVRSITGPIQRRLFYLLSHVERSGENLVKTTFVHLFPLFSFSTEATTGLTLVRGVLYYLGADDQSASLCRMKTF